MDNIFAPTCRFCPEIDNNYLYSEFHNLVGADFGSRIILTSTNFVVFPAIGQIVPGYLLIVPKSHYLSVGYLPEGLFNELETLVREIRQKLEDVYGCKPIFFEHGNLSDSKKAGCCVDHAHIHAVPVEIDLRADIQKLYPERKIEHLTELRGFVEHQIPYIFFQNANGERFAYDAKLVVSQFLRILLSNKLGFPERWDWRAYPKNFNSLKMTKNQLKDWQPSYIIQ
jgi:diadenosine tetraphosphate (Ap4A) HIT family hydrolase